MVGLHFIPLARLVMGIGSQPRNSPRFIPPNVMRQLKRRYQMNYTIEDIYCLVGKDDKTAGLTFKHESEASNLYGSFITVVFVYTQYEREEMDTLVQATPFSKYGRIKAKYFGTELAPDKVERLLIEGVYSYDIAEIFYYAAPSKNTFHSKEKRQLNIIEISMRPQLKGGDLDWMYGFSKKLTNEGIVQCPRERSVYLAGKLFYEHENLTREENEEVFGSGKIDEKIEYELLQMKYIREEISDEEKKRLVNYYGEKEREKISILDNYLKKAGSSLKKLLNENIDQAAELFMKVMDFKERRLNVLGKQPIYIDLDSYLHIYMRHVEEFQVNRQFENKDNFQWNEEDVFNVMEHVIEYIDKEYQEYRNEKPTQRFSKYGRKSIYFEGDYYTFHIEPNGKISTFHKNKKGHEQI